MKQAIKEFRTVARSLLDGGYRNRDLEQRFVAANEELFLKTGTEYHPKFFTEILKGEIKQSNQPREALEPRVARLITLVYG